MRRRIKNNLMEAKLKAILAGHNEEDQKLIQEAYEFALAAHEGQTRKTGDPYINHPLETAIILTELKLDAATIAAAMLHDVPENTDGTIQDIGKKFGDEVAYLVNGVTRLTKVRLRGSHEPGYVENLRKMR